MQTRTSDLLFGTGRTSLGQGMAMPEEPVRFGDLLGTMRGRDRVEEALRSQLPSRRSAAQEAADLLGSAEPTRNLIAGGGATATGAAALGAGQVEYANPIYGGLYAQSLIRDHGFVPPLAAGTPAGAPSADAVVETATAPVRAVAADAPAASTPIAEAAADVAAGIADHEQRMLTALQGLGELPSDRQVAALTAAVDATAQHGGDTYSVLARTITERPLEDAAAALERAVDDASRVAKSAAPVVDEAAKAAKVAAPVVDDAAKVAKVAATAVQHAPFVPVPGLMSFKDGIDDTLRLLARI